MELQAEGILEIIEGACLLAGTWKPEATVQG